MCGICGIWGAGPADDGASRLGAMLASVAHRGPDHEARLSRPGVELGMRRLASIDIGGGTQPVVNEAGTVGVVFDGEVDNFPELRARLEANGHRFATRSDTEVLAHGYEQWGEDLPHELSGTFAFAVWDSRSNRLLVVRDRFGEKPLYWARLDGEIVLPRDRVPAAGRGVGRPR